MIRTGPEVPEIGILVVVSRPRVDRSKTEAETLARPEAKLQVSELLRVTLWHVSL